MPADLTIENGRIVSISPIQGECDMDLGTNKVLPGFIDIHCHGAYGFDTNYAREEGMKKWQKNITHEGVTSFLATTITDHKEVLLKALKNADKVMHENNPGAHILGIHFEGPYLSKKHAGAQPLSCILPPDIEEAKEYMAACHNNIRIMTYAPEEDKDGSFTRFLRENNIVPSIGHTDATYEDCQKARKNGAMSMTHTFNAMTPLHHRKPGAVGFALNQSDMYSEIICDTFHVDKEVLKIFFKSKDEDKSLMITDALYAKGLKPGTVFEFGGQPTVLSESGLAFIQGTNTIAGSTLKMNVGLRNLIEKAGVPYVQAILSSSQNQADLLGEKERGRLLEGCYADITVLDDDYEVVHTFVDGILQF